MPLGGLAPLPLPLGGTKVDGLVVEQHARICADLLAVTKTARFALVVFATNSTTVKHYSAQAGDPPVITLNGLGDATVTWAAGITDDYNATWPMNIRHASGKALIVGSQPIVVVQIVTPNSVRVRCFDPINPVDGTVALSVW